VLASAGCEKEPTTALSVVPIERTVAAGEIEFTVRTDRDEVGVAEPLQLTLEVSASQGLAIQFPIIDGPLGEFTVRDVRSEPALPSEGRQLHHRTYVLESYAAGELTIPELTIGWTRDGEDPEELSSPELRIRITSAIDGEFVPSEFADIKGTVQLAAPASWAWLWWLAGSIVVLAVAAFVLAKTRQSRQAELERQQPAHVLALTALDALARAGLLQDGRYAEYFARLSNIIREYIERRWSVHAPQRSTPEFLEEIRHDAVFDATHRQSLAAFLQACDLVKFACYVPSTNEQDESTRTARAFVETTAADAEETASTEVAA
jgi:hypothetical protein